jgi:hypothetical protein
MSERAATIVVLLIGLVAAVGAAAAWTGAWRSWARQFLLGAVGSWPITLLPGIAAMCLAGGLSSLGAASGPVALLFLAGLLLLGLFLVNPRWWGPAWYRTVRSGLRDGSVDPDMQDPSTALFVGAAGGKPPYSSAAVAEQFSGEPHEGWPVTWITGPETAQKAHALQRPGSVTGRLELRREGILFVASAAEDRVREAATVLWIRPEEVTGAWAVPPGAGADGVRLPAGGMTARLARRLVPRLVISTAEGRHLFESYRAEAKARRILELYERGQPVAPASK